MNRIFEIKNSKIMKNQKKWELLKYAYDNYPKGTKFDTPCEDKVSTGVFTLWQKGFNTESPKNGVWRVCENGKPSGMVFDGRHWVKILTEKQPKIAVKVENEKEFDSLQKYLKTQLNVLGWHKFPKCIRLDNLGYSESSQDKDAVKDILEYVDEVISFSDFAKEHNIKFPLIKSEDGLWLHEGDEFFSVHKRDFWEFIGRFELIENDLEVRNNSIAKAFTTKQAALEWIEAQKPKRKFLDFCIVEKDSVTFDDSIKLTISQIKQIQNAFKELS